MSYKSYCVLVILDLVEFLVDGLDIIFEYLRFNSLEEY